MKLILIIVSTVCLIQAGTSQECPPDEFQCESGRCIPIWWVCDGYDDCNGDGSDEPSDPDLCPPCRPHEWRCDNGDCIEDWYVCDFEEDCRDGSDEQQDCPQCPSTWWMCRNNVTCIPPWGICNGYDDCDDGGNGSDESEEACPCTEDEMRCPRTEGRPGICIPNEQICDPDGIWDCPDGADEANCSTQQSRQIWHKASPLHKHKQGTKPKKQTPSMKL